MAEFNLDFIDVFLGVVRKYMQMRGSMSQKDLAEVTEVGVSTMSRFLNRKTNELNPQLIAKIVAKLKIPLHEIIDFVEEEYNDRFIRLVKFYRDDHDEAAPGVGKEKEFDEDQASRQEDTRTGLEDDLTQTLSTMGTAKRKVKAHVNIGGKTRSMPFEPDQNARNSEMSVRDKLESLTPRQKAYLTDFLNLDMEGKDLMVDLGNSLFRYFKQKGMEF